MAHDETADDRDQARLLAHRRAQRGLYVSVAGALAGALLAALYTGTFADRWRAGALVVAFLFTCAAAYFGWRMRRLRESIVG